MVFGTDTIDLYFVLVETIFGSILFSGVAVVLTFLILCVLFRMSPLLIIFIIGGFVLHFGIGYGGAIFAVFGMILGLIYFAVGIWNYIGRISQVTQ